MSSQDIVLVESGDIAELRDFAIRLAVQIDPLHTEHIEWNDGVPVVQTKEYLLETINEIEEWLEVFHSKTEEELREAYEADIAKEASENEALISQCSVAVLRLEKMLKKVGAFEPPTPEHVHLKELMVERLAKAIDKKTSAVTVLKSIESPTFEKWKKDAIESAEVCIRMYQESYEGSVGSAASYNFWIKQLLEAIDG